MLESGRRKPGRPESWSEESLITGFLSSAVDHDLDRAFARIRNPEARKSIVDMAQPRTTAGGRPGAATGRALKRNPHDRKLELAFHGQARAAGQAAVCPFSPALVSASTQ